MLTGGLTGSLDGLPVEINASAEEGLTIKLFKLRSAVTLWRFRKSLGGIVPVLQSTGLDGAVEIVGGVRLRVSPAPGPLVRWLLGG